MMARYPGMAMNPAATASGMSSETIPPSTGKNPTPLIITEAFGQVHKTRMAFPKKSGESPRRSTTAETDYANGFHTALAGRMFLMYPWCFGLVTRR